MERELFGAVFNTTKVYAHCPPILKAAKQLSASIEKSGRLPSALPVWRLPGLVSLGRSSLGVYVAHLVVLYGWAGDPVAIPAVDPA